MDKVNKTQLNIEQATERGIVHRDYIAHCLRWNYALKFIEPQSEVLDVGCGNGMLAQVLYVNKYKPKSYVGVDIRDNALQELKVRKVNFPVQAVKMDIRRTRFGELWKGKFDVVTCFEVIEHFEPEYLDHVLNQIGLALKGNGTLLLSTPNYNGKDKAANHIHEYVEKELEEAFKENWFVIDKKIGTFASQKDIVQVLTPCELGLFNRLKEFLDSNILSIVFASLHPSQSRNILWVCHPAVR